LHALVAAGANCEALMADPWIKKVALEIGLQNGELYSALTYAGTQEWLTNRQKEGWTSLTRRVKPSQSPNNAGTALGL
jgi:hypothetical protein